MPNGGHSAKRTSLDAVRPLPIFAECQALGKGHFAECHILPSAALGEAGLCRVPEIWHSAKIFALDKSRFSRSMDRFYLCLLVKKIENEPRRNQVVFFIKKRNRHLKSVQERT